MSKNKKLLISLIVLSVVFLAIIVTTVVVLVASNQKAQSNIIVSYEASGVKCDISATYYYDSTIGKQDMTVNGIKGNSTTLTFTDSTETGVLSPWEEIKLTEQNTTAVLEYKFTNTSKDIPMSITFAVDLTASENIELGYYMSSSEISASSYASTTLIDGSIAGQSLVVPTENTKYVYIFASVADTSQNANLELALNWSMLRTVSTGTIAQSGTTLTNGNAVATATGVYAGNYITESDLTNSLYNAYVVDWYTDPGCTTKAEFPLVSTDSTVLYGEYLEGNIPASNLSYDPESDSYTVDAEPLAATTASTVSKTSAYKTITTTDTTLVIPDRFKGPYGTKPVTKITNGTTSASLLQGNTTIQKIYLGNNITSIGDYFAKNCTALTYIDIPKNITYLGKQSFYGCTGLTQIDYNAVACADLTSSTYAFYNAGKTSEGIILNISAQVKLLPNFLFGTSGIISSGGQTIDAAKIIEVNIPENSLLEKIGSGSFTYCRYLTSITFPENLKELAGFGHTGLNIINYNAVNCTVRYSSENGGVSNVFSDIGEVTINIGPKVESIPDFLFTSNTNGVGSVSINFAENSVCKSIGKGAFRDCSRLTSLSLPESIVSIGDDAFECGCSGSITIPTNVTSIGSSAFANFTALESITLSKNVQSLGDNPFRGCNNLKSIVVASDNAFYTSKDQLGIECNIIATKTGKLITACINSIIHSTINTIGNYAFGGCSGLTSITIPEGVSSIGNYAFGGCSGLTSITIPESVTSIGSRAFYDCSGLTEINYNAVVCADLTSSTNAFYNAGKTSGSIRLNIGAQVKKLPAYLFYTSSSSYYVRISTVNFAENSVCESIGNYAFYNCSGLTSITIPESVTSIGSRAFYNCSGLTEINYNAVACADLTSSSYVFYNAGQTSGSITLNIGAQVQKIPAYLFYGPTTSYARITTVNFAENTVCESIGTYAFENCRNLTSFTIPSSVLEIKNSAFYDCSKLNTVFFKDTSNWYYAYTGPSNTINLLSSTDLANTTTAATYLKTTYVDYYIYKKSV